VSAVLLIVGFVVGALVGATAAIAFTRSSRERLREELQGISSENREQLRTEMEAISASVLKQTGDSLSQRLVEQQRAEHERAAGEMAKRAEEWKGLVQPVNEKLGKVESEIGRLERERKEAQGQLSEMVRSMTSGTDQLRRETGNLVSALKGSSTRGSWGELHLRRVIEMAGMVAHCDFVEQSTLNTDDGRLRPDVLVHLPGDKLIVIDSKFPGGAFFKDLEAGGAASAESGSVAGGEARDAASGETAGAAEMTQHAKQMRDHITKLASKGYSSQFDSTPEVVVMFVPSDGNYLAALAGDPTLIEYGVNQGVLIATPTTLIGLLRAIDYGWRQERIAESARKIAETGRELHKRLATFIDPLAKLGRQLSSAVDAYNQASRSFDTRLAPKVKELSELGASSGREISPPVAIDAGAVPPHVQLAEEPANNPPLSGERALEREQPRLPAEDLASPPRSAGSLPPAD
jgi:DNA recombination protein RmuC